VLHISVWTCCAVPCAPLLVAASSARAQDIVHAPPLATSAGGAAHAPSSLAEPADPAVAARYARAREVVVRAEALFSAGNYEAAWSDFVEAHRLLEGHPRRYVVRHNMAVCQERLFRYDLALRLYEQYLEEGGPDAEDRGAVVAVLATLRGLLGALIIDANVQAEIWIDDRRVADAPARVSVPAGRHVVELRSSLHQAARREVQVVPQRTYALRFELSRLSDYRGLSPVYFWSAAGLTAAALVTGAVFGLQALDARDTGEAHASESMQLRTAAAERSERAIAEYALAADVAFGAAALLAAGSTLLLFMTDWSEGPPERAAAPSARLALSPRGVVLQGRWQ
jgi:hypothetical protein